MGKGLAMVKMVACATAALALSGCQRDTSPIDFDVCMVKAESKSACKDLLSFSVHGETSMLARTPYYSLEEKLGAFGLRLAEIAGVPSYLRNGKYEVSVITAIETPDMAFNRYMSLPELPVNKGQGSLVVLKESDRGETGTALLMSGDGDKRSLFFCTKPYRATAGNLVEDTGCTVRAELQRYVFIEYPIRYQSLRNWQEIHRTVVEQIGQVMLIKRTLKD